MVNATAMFKDRGRVRVRVRVWDNARVRVLFSLKVSFRPGAKARSSVSVTLEPGLRLGLRLGLG